MREIKRILNNSIKKYLELLDIKKEDLTEQQKREIKSLLFIIKTFFEKYKSLLEQEYLNIIKMIKKERQEQRKREEEDLDFLILIINFFLKQTEFLDLSFLNEKENKNEENKQLKFDFNDNEKPKNNNKPKF